MILTSTAVTASSFTRSLGRKRSLEYEEDSQLGGDLNSRRVQTMPQNTLRCPRTQSQSLAASSHPYAREDCS